jgi:DnaJ-class molecular chaperone
MPVLIQSARLSFTHEPNSESFLNIRERNVMADNLPTATVQCASCKGTGGIEKLRCHACDGNGHLLVVAPAIPCPRCSGTGISPNRDPLLGSQTCAVCVGAGWARIVWS